MYARGAGGATRALPKLPLPITLRRSKSSICIAALVWPRHAIRQRASLLSHHRHTHARTHTHTHTHTQTPSDAQTTARKPHATSRVPLTASPSPAAAMAILCMGAFCATRGAPTSGVVPVCWGVCVFVRVETDQLHACQWGGPHDAQACLLARQHLQRPHRDAHILARARRVAANGATVRQCPRPVKVPTGREGVRTHKSQWLFQSGATGSWFTDGTRSSVWSYSNTAYT
jgi:hypothetical protein